MTKVIGRGRYATETYPSKSGGIPVPTTNTNNWCWIYSGTSVPLSEQTGAEDRPFSTLAAALAAGFIQFYISDSAGDVTLTALYYQFQSVTGRAVLQNIQLTGAQSVFLEGCIARNWSWAPEATQFAGVHLTGGPYSPPFAPASADVVDIVLPGALVTIEGWGISGDLVCDRLALVGSSLNAAAVEYDSGAQFLNCNFHSEVTCVGSAPGQWVSCVWRNTMTIQVPLGSVVTSETLAAITWTNASPIELDAYSDARMTAASATFSGGSTVIG